MRFSPRARVGRAAASSEKGWQTTLVRDGYPTSPQYPTNAQLQRLHDKCTSRIQRHTWLEQVKNERIGFGPRVTVKASTLKQACSSLMAFPTAAASPNAPRAATARVVRVVSRSSPDSLPASLVLPRCLFLHRHLRLIIHAGVCTRLSSRLCPRYSTYNYAYNYIYNSRHRAEPASRASASSSPMRTRTLTLMPACQSANAQSPPTPAPFPPGMIPPALAALAQLLPPVLDANPTSTKNEQNLYQRHPILRRWKRGVCVSGEFSVGSGGRMAHALRTHSESSFSSPTTSPPRIHCLPPHPSPPLLTRLPIRFKRLRGSRRRGRDTQPPHRPRRSHTGGVILGSLGFPALPLGLRSPTRGSMERGRGRREMGFSGSVHGEKNISRPCKKNRRTPAPSSPSASPSTRPPRNGVCCAWDGWAPSSSKAGSREFLACYLADDPSLASLPQAPSLRHHVRVRGRGCSLRQDRRGTMRLQGEGRESTSTRTMETNANLKDEKVNAREEDGDGEGPEGIGECEWSPSPLSAAFPARLGSALSSAHSATSTSPTSSSPADLHRLGSLPPCRPYRPHARRALRISAW
ncbi:hypothetical protein B0H19DRAFT_1068660 [Mycena capillaripes]|nr:hypothetical protein B0H19DRAFT_1068660 [Mycena capillaripes]